MPRGVKKVAEAIEEVKVEEAVAEEAKEEKVEEVAAEEPKVEEVAAEEAPAEEVAPEEDQGPAPEVIEEAPAAEEVKEAPEKEEQKPVESADGTWKFVENLRIYPRVTDLAVTTVITGNVKVIGEVRGLKKIQYMKHGFGLVEALTDAL